jgi:hypothetical protein
MGVRICSFCLIKRHKRACLLLFGCKSILHLERPVDQWGASHEWIVCWNQ